MPVTYYSKLTRSSDTGLAGLEEQPLASFLRDWLAKEVDLPIQRSHPPALAPSTAKIHRHSVENYLVPFFKDRLLSELRPKDIQAFFDWCIERGNPRSPRSVDMLIATLRRALGNAEALELIDRNPVHAWSRSRGRKTSSARAAERPANVLDSEELSHLLDVTRQFKPRHYPFILFLAHTGCRLGEASRESVVPVYVWPAALPSGPAWWRQTAGCCHQAEAPRNWKFLATFRSSLPRPP